MNFSTLLESQEKVVKILKNSLEKDRLVSIYLFEGAKGTLKREAAYYFASLVMCEGKNKPCYECLSCKRIANGKHPRIYEINKNSKGNIGKGQIDDLEHEFSMVGLEEGPRVFIINEVEALTTEAANRLLKFLEETKEGTYGILIAENLGQVISTIKSRSQVITFQKIPNEINTKIYIDKGINEEIAKILPLITNNTDEGLELINEGKIIDVVELVKKINFALLYSEKDPLITFYENAKFLLSEKDKKYHTIFLDLLAIITNDRIYRKLNQNDQIVFTSIELDDNQEIEQTFYQVEKILEYKQRVKYNINIELMYVEMFIEIER